MIVRAIPLVLLLACAIPLRGQTETFQRFSALTGFPVPRVGAPDRLSGNTQNASLLDPVVKQFEETSTTVRDLAFVDDNLGWAVGTPHWDATLRNYTGSILKTTDGGATWTWQDAGAAPTLWCVQFTDADHGWVAGVAGTVLRTQDGGAHWTPLAIPTTDDIRGLSFPDALHGWATSIHPIHWDYSGDPDDWQGSIWRTVDGGQTWEQQTVPESTSLLNQVRFVDALRGWVVGTRRTAPDPWGETLRAAVYHTTDGGAHWVEVFGQDHLIVLAGLDFLDGNEGWVAGFRMNSGVQGGLIFHTTDGGTTWTRQEASGIFWDIDLVDNQRGFAVGSTSGQPSPLIYRTLDGGTTWQEFQIQYDEENMLFCLSCRENRALAAGWHDFFCHAGDPWQDYSHQYTTFDTYFINTHYSFYDICFPNPRDGWAVGDRSFKPMLHGQVIFHTADGGLHWESQYERAPMMDALFSWFRLYGVSFVDSSNGWACGESHLFRNLDNRYHNAILHTADGGQTWQEQGLDITGDVNKRFWGVQFLDALEGWAVQTYHSGGFIYLAHTLDGGQSWNWVNTGIAGDLPFQGGLCFTDSRHGWVVGGRGNVLYTGDGGASWQDLPPPSSLAAGWDRLYAVTPGAGSAMWVTGADVCHSPDGVSNWAVDDTGYSLDFEDIRFPEDRTGWLCGWNGVILNSGDGGHSWQRVPTDTGADLHTLSFINARKGWFAGDCGVILTTDAPEPGDLDGDGTVGAADPVLLASLLAGSLVDNQVLQPVSAELNGDRKVNILDLLQLMRLESR